METVKVIELTDEEIWLRAYCASVGNSRHMPANWAWAGDTALHEFKERFKGKENGK